VSTRFNELLEVAKAIHATRRVPPIFLFRARYSKFGVTLLCGANPSSGSESRVLLINRRINKDDVVRTSPQSDGTFALELTVDSISSTMNPELWIYTNCAAKTLGIPPGCQRLQKIKIPSSYVNSRQPYDLGTRNLAAKQPDEEQSC
jgi:Transthyretin-like family